MPRDDFNYKVALAAGSKSLAAGQLHKAEEQFRFAMQRCPECGAGYRGLAKVYVELDDRAAALEILRTGAQTLARAGNRSEAIELLREAARLAPDDLAIHRRLAAALANAGDRAGAAEEYVRYASKVLGSGDLARAELEIAYAQQTLGQVAGFDAIVAGIRVARGPVPSGAATPIPEAPPVATALSTPAAPPAPSALADEPLPSDPLERAILLDARAQELIARSDSRAASVALEAARTFLRQGLDEAAADLLLQIVATGCPDRPTQALLIEIARRIGRVELSREKRLLLARALRLDGHEDAAAEVERRAPG